MGLRFRKSVRLAPGLRLNFSLSGVSAGAQMLSSRATVSTAALSGGNSLATALSLNACPYLATSSFPYRPLVSDSNEATCILTQGALSKAFDCGQGSRYANATPDDGRKDRK